MTVIFFNRLRRLYGACYHGLNDAKNVCVFVNYISYTYFSDTGRMLAIVFGVIAGVILLLLIVVGVLYLRKSDSDRFSFFKKV